MLYVYMYKKKSMPIINNLSEEFAFFSPLICFHSR